MRVTKPLKPGDEIRIIGPSASWDRSRIGGYKRSAERLKKLGYKVTYGENIKVSGRFKTAPVQARLEDFHQAYSDKAVKAILCVTGGWSANELLPGINWEHLHGNNKPLIGFSDITVLLNAIFAKTGNIGLLGPNFGSLGRQYYHYSLENLQKVLISETEVVLERSKQWEPSKNKLQETRPWKILQSGQASGVLIGGNLGTYYLLQGTEYAPQFKGDTILAIEDDDEAGKLTAREFDRRLESLLQQPNARTAVKGVLIGRFQLSSKVTMPDIKDIVSRKFHSDVPVIADMDFGHTKPLLTFPIGGMVSIDAMGRKPTIKLIEY